MWLTSLSALAAIIPALVEAFVAFESVLNKENADGANQDIINAPHTDDDFHQRMRERLSKKQT